MTATVPAFRLAARVTDLVAPSAFGAVLGPPPAELIALTGGSPDASALPAAELSAATATVLGDSARAAAALDYSGHQGHPGLRAWIAGREGTTADRVVITNGALHALSLPLLATVDPGEQVVVENPVYPLVLKVLQLPGAVPVPIPVDEDGLQVDELERRLQQGLRPRAVYTVPDFHNPTGRTLSGERRLRLVELAEHYGFLVVSDNPYKELRGTGAPLPDLDLASDRVVRANTFSKVLGPGLRLGWTVLPAPVVPGVLDLRSRLDQHASSLVQAVVAELVGRPGLFDSIAAQAAVLYRSRGEAFVAALREHLGDAVQVALPDGGLFSWPSFPDLADTTELATRVLARGIAVLPGSQFAAGPGTDAATRLRASFGQQSVAVLQDAAARIATAHADVTGAAS